MQRSSLWALLVLLSAGPSFAQVYLDQTRTLAGTPQSTTERFTFTIQKDSPCPHLSLDINMTQGRVDLRILDSAGKELETAGASQCTLGPQPMSNARNPGTYTAEITTTDALGRWHLRIFGQATSIGPAVLASSAMVVVALASVGFWRARTGVAYRWFWAGAAVWTVAVIAKVAFAIPFHQHIIDGLKASLPRWAYLTTGTIYGGVMTGLTEVIFTLIAALIWRRMASTSARGVAIGVGAGAFEAALIGVGLAVATIGFGQDSPTWSLALAPAVERVTAILCHTASRALTLLAVARRRWILFWYGFLLLSCLDAVATLMQLTGDVQTLSPWTMEALLGPFGVISVPIIVWCIRRWPHPADEAAETNTGGCEATGHADLGSC